MSVEVEEFVTAVPTAIRGWRPGLDVAVGDGVTVRLDRQATVEGRDYWLGVRADTGARVQILLVF